MLSEKEIEVLNNLKEENIEAYNLFLKRESEYKSYIKKSCHDVLNTVTILSSTHQLLSHKHPSLNEIPRWLDIPAYISELSNGIMNISRNLNQI